MFISVIITTKNRPDGLAACINAICANAFSASEILVVDQSSNEKTHALISRISKRNGTPIRYIKMHTSNLSMGRNTGIVYAKGDICAFTDDDCIVTNSWLSEIARAFRKMPKTAAVFGRTLPFMPHLHKELTCPGVFARTGEAVITTPCMHDRYIGLGNNMAIRRSVFKAMGGFKEWLGVGSFGRSAEDAEYAQRILIHKKPVLYTSRVTVFHNKWLRENELVKQNLSYDFGEMACYGYFYLQGYRFAVPIVARMLRDSFQKMKLLIKRVLLLQWDRGVIKHFRETCMELFVRLSGLSVGAFCSVVDPIRL